MGNKAANFGVFGFGREKDWDPGLNGKKYILKSGIIFGMGWGWRAMG